MNSESKDSQKGQFHRIRLVAYKISRLLALVQIKMKSITQANREIISK